MSPDSVNGSAPISDMMSHASATTTKPSRAYTLRLFGFLIVITVPMMKAIAAVRRNQTPADSR